MGEEQEMFSHHVLCGIPTLVWAVLLWLWVGPGVLGHGDTDWLFSGLAFSGDRQDREDKTSHELLAQRYLFPRKALWDVFGMGSLRSITALSVGAQGALRVSAPGGCPGAALLWGW